MSKFEPHPSPHRSRSWLAALAVGLAAPGVAAAQSPTQLPGLVIQGATLSPPPARRTAEPRTEPATPSQTAPIEAGTPATPPSGSDRDAGYRIDTIGSAVTVVTGDDIRRQQLHHVGDALRSLPGVAVSRGGSFGALTQVRIRGAEANHTLVLIDGVVANDTNNGAFDFSDLSTDNVERIEVIRGPQSGLYGSNALGGVINIVTKGGRGPLELTVRSEAGSFGTFDYALRASGGNEQAWGSFSYHERHVRGFNIAPFGIEDDGATLKTFHMKGGVRLAEGLVVDFTLRQTDKRGDRDTEGGPVGSLAVQVDDPTRFGSKIFLGGMNLRWDTLDGRLTHNVRVTRNETHITDRSPTFLTDNTSETWRYGYLGTIRFDTPALMPIAHVVSVLIEQENEDFLPSSDFADNVIRSRSRLATAIEHRMEFWRRLTVTSNLRRDDNDIYKDFTTWRTALSLRVPEVGLRPHASIGTGVKLPTMFETYGLIPGFFTPNPNLLPEESKGWDAGVELSLWNGRAVLDVTYFEQDLRNRIDGFAAGPAFTFTAVNTPGISRRDGIEVSGRLQVTPALLLSAAYTHLTALDSNGLDEIRRPRHSGRADITYVFGNGRGTTTLSAIYNGTMDDTAFRILGPFFSVAERVGLDSYWLVNASASYKVLPGMEIFGRVENLLNEKYYEIYGFATPGVAAYAGVKLTFGGEGDPAFAKPRQ